MRFKWPDARLVAIIILACLVMVTPLCLVLSLAGCIAQDSTLPTDITKEATATKPAEIVFTPHTGAVTAIDEIVKLKAAVNDLANRPIKCDCECGKHAYAKSRDSPGPFPAIVWRVDPLSPYNLQLGYEAGGYFYVLSTMRANQ